MPRDDVDKNEDGTEWERTEENRETGTPLLTHQ